MAVGAPASSGLRRPWRSSPASAAVTVRGQRGREKIVASRSPDREPGRRRGKQQLVNRTPEEAAMGITRQVPAGESFEARLLPEA
jgi:hypothetical protein